MALASLSGSGIGIVLASYLVLIVILYLARPRDVNGRRRANGCIFGIAVLGGLIVLALASWANAAIF